MGLKDEMLKAKTIEQLNKLFESGASFEKPSAKTVRRWEKAKETMTEKLTVKPKVESPKAESLKAESLKAEKKEKKQKKSKD